MLKIGTSLYLQMSYYSKQESLIGQFWFNAVRERPIMMPTSIQLSRVVIVPLTTGEVFILLVDQS
jgi:hypothetical protein